MLLCDLRYLWIVTSRALVRPPPCQCFQIKRYKTHHSFHNHHLYQQQRNYYRDHCWSIISGTNFNEFLMIKRKCVIAIILQKLIKKWLPFCSAFIMLTHMFPIGFPSQQHICVTIMENYKWQGITSNTETQLAQSWIWGMAKGVLLNL